MGRIGPHAKPTGEARRRECAKAGGLYLWKKSIKKDKKGEYWVEPR